MKLFFALLAVAALSLAAASNSFANKGYGGYGNGYGGHGHGYGHGYGGYAGYGGYGHHHGGYGYGQAWCPHCSGHGHHGGLHGLRHYNDFGNVPQLPPPTFTAGPPVATVTYPYYTTRGPRDFLQNACGPNPILPWQKPKICLPSIGP